MMEIIKGKDLIWDTDNYDVILVGTSIYNLLTQGIQSKLVVKYPDMKLEDANNSTPYADIRKLGKRITVSGEPSISLMYICKYPHSKRVFLDYDALEKCLDSANMEFKGKKVATTVLGASRFDGNGDKDRCLGIIKEHTKDMDLHVYDYEQLRKRDEIKSVYQKFNEYAQKGDWDTWWSLVYQKDEIIKKFYLRH